MKQAERETGTALQHRKVSRKQSLSSQVYEYLSEQIIRGVIKYGDRLNIKNIAADLEVSPMPIRDALKRLEMEQVVVIRPRSTCFVRVPTKAKTLEAIAARRMLETFAVREVCTTVTAAELSTVKSVLDDMAELIRRTAGNRTRAAVDDYIELDRQFHTDLCALARNDYVNRFYRETDMHLSMSFRYGVGVCHGIEATFQDHEQIYRQLAANSCEAVELLEQHLLRSRQNIMNEPTFQVLEE